MEFPELDNPLFSYQNCNRTNLIYTQKLNLINQQPKKSEKMKLITKSRNVTYFVKATTIDKMRRISGTNQFHEREVVKKLKKANSADTALGKN